MARRVRSAILDSMTARDGLAIRGKPYYQQIDEGLHLGYRKNRQGGKWVLRSYLGQGQGYELKTFAVTDDRQLADGHTVLSFMQAQRRAREIHQDLKRDALGVKRSSSYTVADCMADYLAWLRERGKPAQRVEYNINAWILPQLGKIECRELTTERIQAWLSKVASSPARLRIFDSDDDESLRRRKSTANRILNTLKAALNRTWKTTNHIPSDKAWKVAERFEGADAARVRYLTVDEAKRLINACPADLRELVKGALATGARYGELCRMNCQDYNPDSGTVHVLKSKTGKARHIRLGEEGIDLLNGLIAGRAGSDPIFRKSNSGRWGRAHQGHPFREACKRSKIEGASFHTLRHTWASLAIMNGLPLVVAADNLGHSDTRMCERHYGHLAHDYKKKMIQEMAPRFGMIEESAVERIGGRS